MRSTFDAESNAKQSQVHEGTREMLQVNFAKLLCELHREMGGLVGEPGTV